MQERKKYIRRAGDRVKGFPYWFGVKPPVTDYVGRLRSTDVASPPSPRSPCPRHGAFHSRDHPPYSSCQAKQSPGCESTPPRSRHAVSNASSSDHHEPSHVRRQRRWRDVRGGHRRNHRHRRRVHHASRHGPVKPRYPLDRRITPLAHHQRCDVLGGRRIRSRRSRPNIRDRHRPI